MSSDVRGRSEEYTRRKDSVQGSVVTVVHNSPLRRRSRQVKLAASGGGVLFGEPVMEGHSAEASDDRNQGFSYSEKARCKRAQTQARPSPSHQSPSSQIQTPLGGASRFGKPIGQLWSKGPGKRELERVAREVPSWNSDPTLPQRALKSSVKIKREPQEPDLARQRCSSPEIIVIDDDDPNDISLVFSKTNTIKIKDQRPIVQHTLHRGIDYYLGYLLFLAALATVLFGRVNTFRGKAKTWATGILFGQYKIQNDCSDRVQRLLKAVSYIYPQKSGTQDAETGLPKGKQPYAEKFSAMFKTGPNGKKVCPKPMVALSCAGLHSAIEDWSSGEQKVTDFEGSRAQDVYETHMAILERVENQKPAQYWALMETIFETVSRGTVDGKASLSAMQREALEMLDI
ncbi:hypothetical protein B0H13DRAFT_1852217 [Mycena leptocephala]|nr:hypothetical protein B0H13DRAFT_1852217 [Mycena leptocephala]